MDGSTANAWRALEAAPSLGTRARAGSLEAPRRHCELETPSSLARVLGRRTVDRLGVHVSRTHHLLDRGARGGLLSVWLIAHPQSLGNAHSHGLPGTAC